MNNKIHYFFFISINIQSITNHMKVAYLLKRLIVRYVYPPILNTPFWKNLRNFQFNFICGLNRNLHRNLYSAIILNNIKVSYHICSETISLVKSTRCTNVTNLFYFRMTLYMFRTVFPSIIRSSRLYIQQQEYVKQILLSACRQRYLFDIFLLLYIQSWTPDDRRKDRPKHVECHSKIK